MEYSKIFEIETELAEIFAKVEQIAFENTKRVLNALQKHRVSDNHFDSKSGYGYDDVGRDTLDKVYADVFGAESGLVRVQFVNGTHAIACALRAVAPNGGYLSLVGKPYDTLQKVMSYDYIEVTAEGKPDFEAIETVLKTNKTKVVLIQRSRGYSTRDTLTINDIAVLTNLAKSYDCIVVVDNCYGEFVENREPTMVGADLCVGSLIKNPGGGLALTGGYIVGKHEWVEKAAECLTVPGIGRECGSSLGQNRNMYQGFFIAPHVVAQAVKTAIFCAKVLERFGIKTRPSSNEIRSDIIQMVEFGDADRLLKFVQGIQKASPVDSFATPEPWEMPGYDCSVVMAAGTFVQGASIELSCDAPMREPFCAYLQGGITYEAGKLGILGAIEMMGYEL